jgi:glycosyltransferase involved in cell wall biosynthesis
LTPRASFVIPAYNADRWISKSIWSCRNQTIKQIEIIVVNDGSTDGTKDILDWHAKEDSRVHPVHLADNQGAPRCRNTGNLLAQSDHIFVLDSDDMAARNRVKDSLATFQLKGCDLLYGSFFIIDAEGTVQTKMTCLPFDPEKSKRDGTNYICHSTMAYTKKLADDVHYEWEKFGSLGIDDWRFEWDAWKKGYKFHCLKNVLGYYRSLDSSITSQRNGEVMKSFKDKYLAEIL